MEYKTKVLKKYAVEEIDLKEKENLLGMILEDISPSEEFKKGGYLDEELNLMGYYDAPTPGTF